MMGGQGAEPGQSGAPAFRRRVFYIPGFDPFPARRYREIYRSEGAKQAAISGYHLEMRPRPEGAEGYGWSVATRTGGQAAEAEIEVLIWDDLVQSRMPPGLLGIYPLLLRTIWAYVSTRAVFGLLRLRIGPTLAALYPVTVLLAQLGLALALWWGIWRLGLALAGFWGGWAGSLVGALAFWALLTAFKRLDGRLLARYLMFEIWQSAEHLGGFGPDLEARLDSFAEKLTAARQEPWDEVLVVAHSSGAAMAVAVVARSLRARGEGAPLALLTLGHVVPLHSFFPKARGLRRDLQELAGSDRLFWADVSAPGDGACFGLADPVAISGVRPEGARWPLVISAAFRQSLAPETWARLRWRFYRLHFQYLHAFDAPKDYDYFQLTAGPEPMARRWANRKESPQVIRRVYSPHRDLGPDLEPQR